MGETRFTHPLEGEGVSKEEEATRVFDGDRVGISKSAVGDPGEGRGGWIR